MVSTIAIPYETLLMFNEVKTREALRIKEKITSDNFIIFLTELYKRVGSDTLVLDGAWERAKMGRKQ